MAFQLGEIKISGTIDNLSFYHSVFGWLVRQKGGPTRKQFKKSPAFARARENSDEFTLCSRAASSLRALVVKHIGIKDKTLYHRLMKLMRLLANEDQTSARGHRDPLNGMHSTRGKQLLKDFEITSELNLYTILVSAGFIELTDAITKPVEVKINSSPEKPRRKKADSFRDRQVISPLVKRQLHRPFIESGKKIPEFIV